MYKTLNRFDFEQEFENRSGTDQFSSYALGKLFEHFEWAEEDSGESIELIDVIATCYEYTEYSSLSELQADHNDIETEEDLGYNTRVICFEEDCIIIQSY